MYFLVSSAPLRHQMLNECSLVLKRCLCVMVGDRLWRYYNYNWLLVTLRRWGRKPSNFSMKHVENDDATNAGMASTTHCHPRVPRKKTLEQQAVVDEILQVVADQGRRLSLSQTDYSVQRRIEFGLRRQKRLTSEGSSFDDSSSCTSASDLSTSPPPTRQSSISSDEGNSKMFEFSSRPRTLPPLSRRTHRPFRPTPPKMDFDEEIEMNCGSRISRPMSARGQRSRPQRGFTL